MGLRCSLLGHEYGETTTERDREERGGEVVVVERELQHCARCGAEKVLSENTEVRTLDPSPDDVEEPTTGSEPSFSEPATASVASGAGGDTTSEHAPDAAEDDGVILEDDPDQERDRGQWPDHEEPPVDPAEAGSAEPAPWPEQEGEDEGFDAEPASPDDGDATFDFGGGLTPEAAEVGDAGDDEEYVEAPSEPVAGAGTTGTSPPSGSPPKPQRGRREEAETVEDPGFTSAGPVNPPSGTLDDPDSRLVCPECGFERKAARASLRAGDICPECRKGYLAERR